MIPPLLGLHHVTATADDAQEDLDFHGELLGLRLVKKTVNFDNHHVFHFYYGNEHGTPGTIWTTFPYKGKGVPPGRKGAGQITRTSFAVPPDAIDAWRRRFATHHVAILDDGERFAEPFIVVADPSGLEIELIASPGDERVPWTTPEVGASMAIRGLHAVTLTLRDPAPSVAMLTGVLGWEVADEAEGRTRLEVHGGGPGKWLEIVHAPGAPPAMNGLGTVHHVAMAIADGEQQIHARAELVRLGYRVTEVRDRQYFTSIYFREPGGVLYEIATVAPGFLVDETSAGLGTGLKLPPWEEPYRAAIEAGLPVVANR